MMKDTVISSRQKKRELLWLAGAFILANMINAYAIIVYRSPASELVTSVFYVLTATAVIYVFAGMIRIIIGAAVRAVRAMTKR